MGNCLAELDMISSSGLPARDERIDHFARKLNSTCRPEIFQRAFRRVVVHWNRARFEEPCERFPAIEHVVDQGVTALDVAGEFSRVSEKYEVDRYH